MKIEDICKIDVPSDDNAVLYMWATAPKLKEGLQVIEAWGFEYKTHAIWDKEQMGMGYWFRGQHELLMVGVKGKFSPPKASLRTSSVIRGNRHKHSSKPNKIRDYLALCYPDFAKLEMFARTKTEDWDVFGNEVLPDVEIDAESDTEKVDISKAFENF